MREADEADGIFTKLMGEEVDPWTRNLWLAELAQSGQSEPSCEWIVANYAMQQAKILAACCPGMRQLTFGGAPDQSNASDIGSFNGSKRPQIDRVS